MSRDVSGILGEYMLKGWVLTDSSCATAGCSVPLMRSPAARTPAVHFCARCDGSPDTIRPVESSTSVSSSSQLSRSSTPPTEVSSTLSSPVFALPAETEESRRRREQSDAASTAIGQRLLKGWAMLADECPNQQCYGVPLVRPPKAAGGEKDPRKECVICGSVYVTEVDRAGRESLVLEESPAPPPEPKGKAREESSVRELHLKPSTIIHVRVLPSSPSSTLKFIKPPLPPPPQVQSSVTYVPGQPTTLLSTLEQSAQDLESTLRTLSARLATLTARQADSSSIGSVADAISKVVGAMNQVRQLQFAEKQAGETF